MKSFVTKLLPEQVTVFWNVVKFAIEQSLPPIAINDPEATNRILSSILCKKTEVWAEYVKGEEEGNKFECIFLTQFVYDEPSDTKNLLIYSLYGYDEIDSGSWARALITMVKYAKEKKCNQIVAYSSVPRVIEMAKSVGWNTDFTFLSGNVSEMAERFNIE